MLQSQPASTVFAGDRGAYLSAAGTHRFVVTYEFADMAAWAVWESHEDIQKTRNELDTLATDVTTEVWGPSPVVPKPIRPGK